MGVSGAPDIFQGKMSNLMHTLEYVRTYIDDLCVIKMGTYNYYIDKVEVVSDRPEPATLCAHVNKSSFALHKIEYIGYVLSSEGITPQPEKVSAILALKEQQNVKELQRFLGMVQYY